MVSWLTNNVHSIVAVPGLGSNGFGAWKAKGGPEMWLRDFLPEKVSNVRVLLYGYNADLIGPGAGSFASILDMGRALMNQLIMARERPEVYELCQAERALLLTVCVGNEASAGFDWA